MIWKIFKRDVKGLCKNFLALVVALGLCAIPSLYAWFNIYSNWDPYANTASIKIAIVSEDTGYTKEDGTSVNMGDTIIESLHSNDKLGWQFPDNSDTAMESLKAGDYYALIVLGDDFSSSLYDFLAKGASRPTAIYYENSKKNAVASKITDTGRSTLESTINTEFINVCVKTIIEELNKYADSDEDLFTRFTEDVDTLSANTESYSKMIDSFKSSNSQLATSLNNMANQIPEADSLIDSTIATLGDVDGAVDSAVTDISAKLDSSYTLIKQVIDTSMTKLSNAKDLMSSNLELMQKYLTSISEDLGAIQSSIDAIKSTFETTRAVMPDATVIAIEAYLNTMSSVINSSIRQMQLISEGIVFNNEAILESIDLSSDIDSLDTLMDELKQMVNNQLNSYISDLKTAVKSMSSASIAGLNAAKSGMSAASTMILNLVGVLNTGNDTLDNVQTIITDLDKRLAVVKSALSDVQEGSIYAIIKTILTADAESYASFLSEPVEVDQRDVYLVANYGTYVTPFYTTLALWVGGIILVAVVKVVVDYKEKKFAKATNNQKYFGRLMLFLLMGQIQTFIVVIGNLYILKVQCLNPFLFWLASAYASVVFTTFIYTLILAFGDIGKAVAVVMVVLQIAGSGGTYPIELLPEMFQKVYLYFPFPYAINAMREAMCGMYGNAYWIYLLQLSGYLVVSLLIGLLLRKPIMPVRDFFMKRMKDTGFM